MCRSGASSFAGWRGGSDYRPIWPNACELRVLRDRCHAQRMHKTCTRHMRWTRRDATQWPRPTRSVTLGTRLVDGTEPPGVIADATAGWRDVRWRPDFVEKVPVVPISEEFLVAQAKGRIWAEGAAKIRHRTCSATTTRLRGTLPGNLNPNVVPLKKPQLLLNVPTFSTVGPEPPSGEHGSGAARRNASAATQLGNISPEIQNGAGQQVRSGPHGGVVLTRHHDGPRIWQGFSSMSLTLFAWGGLSPPRSSKTGIVNLRAWSAGKR